MNLSHDDLRALWQSRPADDAKRGACLTDRERARVLSNDADPWERERAARHIASCRTCAGQYRLLQPVRSWTEVTERALSASRAVRIYQWWRWTSRGPSRPVALALAAVALLLATNGLMLRLFLDTTRERQQLEAQLEAQLPARSGPLRSAESTLSRSETAPRVVTVQGRETPDTEASLTRLAQRMAALSQTQLDVNIVDLKPNDTRRGAPAGPQTVTTNVQPALVTFVLNFSPLSSRSTLEIEVKDDSGLTRWVTRTDREPGTASLTLGLSTLAYPPGTYVIRLFDVTRARTPVATYPIRLLNRRPGNQR